MGRNCTEQHPWEHAELVLPATNALPSVPFTAICFSTHCRRDTGTYAAAGEREAAVLSSLTGLRVGTWPLVNRMPPTPGCHPPCSQLCLRIRMLPLSQPHRPLTAQVLNILVGGSPDGKGWFFPDGVNTRIKEPTPLNVR